MTTTRKPRLTPHQAETLERLSRRRNGVRISGPGGFGCKGAIGHLVDKGYAVTWTVTGPLGGNHVYAKAV